MSKYPEYRESRQSFGINVLGTLVVEVEASDGTTGFGVTTGGEVERISSRSTSRASSKGRLLPTSNLCGTRCATVPWFYGRKGVVLNAISSVDPALWDLLGKIRQEPVFQLLGGPVRQELEFYVTESGPDLAKEMGFIGGKMPLRHGPSEDEEGFRKNLAELKECSGHCRRLALPHQECYRPASSPQLNGYRLRDV
jgi:L-rhamnonate dehydratase